MIVSYSRSQNATLNKVKISGVILTKKECLMLSIILKSNIAIEVSIILINTSIEKSIKI